MNLQEVKYLQRPLFTLIFGLKNEDNYKVTQVFIQDFKSCTSTQFTLYPEAFMHPENVLKYTESLIDKAISSKEKQVIETHSEHLMLRFLKMVRSKKIEPSDVLVLVVNKINEEIKVTKIEIDGDGDFANDWPNGFFTERLNEIL